MSKINDIKEILNQGQNISDGINKLVQKHLDNGAEPASIIHGLASGVAGVFYNFAKWYDSTPEQILEVLIEGYHVRIIEFRNQFGDYKDISKDMQ